MLLLGLTALPACGPVPCRAKALELTLEYSAAAASADALTIDVTVGATHKRYQRPRTPGKARDTLEVVFSEYPAQSAVTVAASATDGGQLVGVGQAAATLAPSCTTLSLALTASGPVDVDSGAPVPDASVGAGDLASELGAPSSSDLASAVMYDLASTDLAVTPPTIAFTGEVDTELHPNGSSGTLPFDTHCTAGYAIVGFAFAVSTSNGTTTGINRADALCIKPLVTPQSGGGFAVTWDPNHASQIPGVGTSDPVTIQYLCPHDSFLVGFSGRAGPSALYDLVYSCAPILVSAGDAVSLGTTTDGAPGTGVGSNSNGTAFGPVHCPAEQVATSVLESGQSGSPPVSFGFGCSVMSAQ